MTINSYYSDQDLRTQRTNLQAQGYVFGGNRKGDRLIMEIAEELRHRDTLPPHPSNQAFGPD